MATIAVMATGVHISYRVGLCLQGQAAKASQHQGVYARLAGLWQFSTMVPLKSGGGAFSDGKPDSAPHQVRGGRS